MTRLTPIYTRTDTLCPLKTLFRSGGNQGSGLQIATDLAASGLTVLLASRNFDRGKTAAQTVEGDVHPIQLDVTDEASIHAAVAQVKQRFGRLDILINNAAISRAKDRKSTRLNSSH